MNATLKCGMLYLLLFCCNLSLALAQARIPADISSVVDGLSGRNYIGLLLIIWGLILFTAELYMPGGILAFGGIIGFILGSILLLRNDILSFEPGWPVILGLSAITVIIFILLIAMIVRAHRRPVVSGREELIGSIGVITHLEAEGAFMRLRGEIWQVKSRTRLSPGEKVQVKSREGLILWVAPVT